MCYSYLGNVTGDMLKVFLTFSTFSTFNLSLTYDSLNHVIGE